MPGKTVNLQYQPLAQDWYEAITWVNNNLGEIYTIQFPTGTMVLQVSAPVPLPPPPPVPPVPPILV